MKLGCREKLKVVIDTNTVISAPLSEDGNPAKIFELLLIEEIKNFTTDEILTEIIDVFNRDRIRNKISQDKINFIIDNFKKFSQFVIPDIKLNMIKADPDDDKFLGCAEFSGADYIISGDLHLKELRTYKKIKIVSPKEFVDIYLRCLMDNQD